MSGIKREYHRQAIKRHYSGSLRGLAHSQLYRQRGFHGIKLGRPIVAAASLPPSARRSNKDAVFGRNAVTQAIEPFDHCLPA